ncbi:MAG: oligosaccharide flippase family protein [Canidatus Methanoxibalbensis ujae]|nr:oligosaccharide flippase family protein [Candidatus Methanoxibalbensis ujae]
MLRGEEKCEKEENSHGLQDEIADALFRAAKGTALAFFGLVIFGILDFVIKVLVARHTSQYEYGIFSLSLSLFQICVILASLGLQAAAPRCIAFFRGRGEFERARGVAVASLKLSLLASAICSASLFFASPLLTSLFHLPASSQPIFQIFAVSLPFYVTVEMLSSVFRGYDRIQEKVIFRDVLMYALEVIFIAFAVALGYSLLGIICAYFLAIMTTTILFAAYTLRACGVNGSYLNGGIKSLLLFSTPLLIANVSGIIMLRTDNLMLGYFRTADIVGLYNTARSTSQLIQIFLSSLTFIYVSIASQLYSRGQINEVKRCYTVLTKWIFSLTFPFFITVFLFPEQILGFIFGHSYAQASTALQILAAGMLIHVFLGPNMMTLVVLGKTRLSMMNSVIGVAMNATLNIIFIKSHGMTGAAMASAISIAVINALTSVQIFHIHGIHPFTKKYLKPVITSTPLLSVSYLVFGYLCCTSIWAVASFFLLSSAVYGACFLITRSLDEEDMIMLKLISHRLNS